MVQIFFRCIRQTRHFYDVDFPRGKLHDDATCPPLRPFGRTRASLDLENQIGKLGCTLILRQTVHLCLSATQHLSCRHESDLPLRLDAFKSLMLPLSSRLLDLPLSSHLTRCRGSLSLNLLASTLRRPWSISMNLSCDVHHKP